MKRYLLMTISMICIGCSRHISDSTFIGNYVNESGWGRIEIMSDTLKIYNSLNYGRLDEGKPLAVCSFKSINSDFIEVNSIDGSWISVHKGIIINEEETEELTDCILAFKAPNLTTPIRIIVRDYKERYCGIIKDGVCEININNITSDNLQLYDMYLEPINIPDASNLWGQFYGVLYCFFYNKIPVKKYNKITITLNDLEDKTFEQYFIYGEYMQITSSGLKWRNEIYKKQ